MMGFIQKIAMGTLILTITFISPAFADTLFGIGIGDHMSKIEQVLGRPDNRYGSKFHAFEYGNGKVTFIAGLETERVTMIKITDKNYFTGKGLNLTASKIDVSDIGHCYRGYMDGQSFAIALDKSDNTAVYVANSSAPYDCIESTGAKRYHEVAARD